MIESKEIKMPLIFDHPIGRVFYSSVLIRNTCLFILFLIFVPNIIFFVEGDRQFKTYFPTSVAVMGTLAGFYLLVMFLIRTYFAASITKTNNILKHKHSTYSQKGTTKYDLETMKSILFEKFEPNNQYAIFLVDHSAERHPFIEKFTMTIGEKEIMEFISKLNEITGLPVREGCL